MKLQKNYVLFLVSSIIVFEYNNYAFAMEGYALQPGTRARGMAGAFSAQANDSSAIWYNPAALVHYDFIKQDFTLEIGQRVIADSKKSSVNAGDYESLDKKVSVNYLAAYSRAEFLTQRLSDFGFGLSYFSPYQLTVNVDAARSLVDSTPFGNVQAQYHQLSAMVGYALSKPFAIGGTLDFLWLDVSCQDYTPCVDNGPVGAGATLSALYEIELSQDYIIKASGTWHSPVNLAYKSTPRSGIGTVLTDYLPDRPDIKNLGLSLEKPTSLVLFNGNLMIERVDWSSSVKRGHSLPMYQNIAAGIELASLTQSGKSYAVRLGGRIIENKTKHDFEVIVATTGFGFEVRKSHFIDFAYEHKKYRTNDTVAGNWSISYSWQ